MRRSVSAGWAAVARFGVRDRCCGCAVPQRWLSTAGEGETAAGARNHFRGLSFSGCGWLLPFHAGVANALIDAGALRLSTPPPATHAHDSGEQYCAFAGASGGALIAAALACGITPHAIMEQVSDKAGEFAERAMDRYGKLTEFAGLNEMKLVWALSMALSRAFAGASEDGKTTLFIAPGCDMLNHDEYGNTTWHYPLSMRKSSSDGSAAAEGSYEDVSETFRLHTSKEYAGQGEQIFNTYKTGLPNYLLLSHFGFVRPDNEYERISMTSLPNEVDGDRALMRTLQGLAQIKNTNNIHMPLAARSSESSGISPGLIKQFRITMMTSQELQLYYDNVQAMGLDEGSDFSTSMGLSFYVNEELDLLVRFELVKHLHDHYSRIVGHGGAKKIRDQLAMAEMQELKESDENLSSLYRIKAALQITLSEITILHNAIAALMHGKLQKDGSITYDHEHYADLIDSTFTSDGLIEQLKYHDPTLPPIKVKTTVQSHSFSIDASGQGDAFEGLGVAGSHIDGVLSYRQTQSGVGGEHTVG